MKVNRFKSSEISVGRLLEAAIRRLVDLPHMMAWRNGADLPRQASRREMHHHGQWAKSREDRPLNASGRDNLRTQSHLSHGNCLGFPPYILRVHQ